MTREQKEPAIKEEENQQPAVDEMMNPLKQEPEAAPPPPNMRMPLDAPALQVAQKKLPETVNNKQPMNDLMQDFAKTTENYNQLKGEMERLQQHGTHNFMVINEMAEKMKEICEKTTQLNALILMPSSVSIQPIRKRIQLTIKNCRELFTKDSFFVRSIPIELVGFKWLLGATTREKGFLALCLYAEPPNGLNGNYSIEVDQRFSILNALADKDLIRGQMGFIYANKENHRYPSGYGCGFRMAKFEHLLDPNKTFLTPEGNIETCVDFTIKSSTLDHLT